MAEGKTVVLDTGPMIELCDKARAGHALAWLQAMRRLEILAVVPASVATEFLRGAGDLTRARWWLSHFQGLDLGFAGGVQAGILARSAGRRAHPSAVDAQVVQHAVGLGADILTSDPQDIRALAAAAGRRLTIHAL